MVNPLLADTVINIDENRQKVYTAVAGLRFYSTHPDSSHLNYEAEIEYYYLEDHYAFGEHGLDFGFTLGKFIGDWYSNVDLGLELYNRSQAIDTTDNSVISISPSFTKATDEWRFTIGVNSVLDTKGGQTSMSLYPRARFEFNIVENVLIPYMGVTGDKRISSYKRLLEKNPFILPGFIAENEDHGLIGYAGMKGRYSSKMAFDLRLKYSRIFNFHSFVSDSLFLNPRNQFVVVYDDVDIITAGAEVTWNQSEKLKFILRAHYYDYNKDVWHRPDFETSFNASYNLRDKILIDANLFYTGQRYARLDHGGGVDPEIIELKGYFDGNLKAEYRYTRLLSFFLRLNNFSAGRYEEWYQYPVQRFQVMAGFTYAL